MRAPGCDESHGDADCVWRGHECCLQCLFEAARAGALLRPNLARVTENEIATAANARQIAADIRHEAKIARGSPKRRSSRRFVITTVYLRPDQVVDIARLGAETDIAMAQFIREAIDRQLSLNFSQKPRVPLLRTHNAKPSDQT